jgi:hypothetical protein
MLCQVTTITARIDIIYRYWQWRCTVILNHTVTFCSNYYDSPYQYNNGTGMLLAVFQIQIWDPAHF